MDKSFNSFHQMLESTGQKSFNSFREWAKSMAPPQTPQEEKKEPIQEEKINEEPAIEPEIYEEEIRPAGDITSTLIESLSEFGWDDFTEEPPPSSPPAKPMPAPTQKPAPPPKERRPEPPTRAKEPVEEKETYYRIFKDREENFECNISVEGTTLSDSQVRIVLESEAWNFVFYGKIYGDGRCVIPIKKGIPLLEGSIGNIKLEVVADDQLFVGWEDEFKVETSKKMRVEVKDRRSIKVDFNNR